MGMQKAEGSEWHPPGEQRNLSQWKVPGCAEGTGVPVWVEGLESMRVSVQRSVGM